MGFRTRQIHYNGQTLHLYGYAGEGYYEHVQVATPQTALFEYVAARLPVDATVFDVGGGIGLAALQIATHVRKGPIYIFEPNPMLIPVIQRMAGANNVPNFSVSALALADTDGFCDFYAEPSSPLSSHLVLDGTLHPKTTRVQVARIDSFVEQQGIRRLDFIKVCAEGFDIQVVEGAVPTIMRLKTPVFVRFNSYTLQAYGNIAPRAAIERLLSVFPYVYTWRNGAPFLVSGDEGIRLFLHDNLAGAGCVSDVYATFMPLPV